jgi:predicted metallopeptidase
MEYIHAPDLQQQMINIVEKLNMDNVDTNRVSCIRSKGSQARGVIARVHGIDKALQIGIGMKAHYVIEFLELFEKCDEREKTETIIHELLHIPKNFGGGFRHHNYVKNRKVRELYKKYIKKEKNRNYNLFGDRY